MVTLSATFLNAFHAIVPKTRFYSTLPTSISRSASTSSNATRSITLCTSIESVRKCVLTFKKAFADNWGPRMEDIIRHTILALMRTPGCSMLDMLPFLTEEEKRDAYVSRVNDPVVNHYWRNIFPKSPGTRS